MSFPSNENQRLPKEIWDWDWVKRKILDGNEGERVEALRAVADYADEVPDLLPATIECLYDASAWVRRGACIAAAAFGPAAEAAIPQLDVISREEDISNVRSACKALASVGKEVPEAVIPAIVRTLRHPDRHARQGALFALKKLGTGLEAAIPELTALLQDTEYDSRAWSWDRPNSDIAYELLASLNKPKVNPLVAQLQRDMEKSPRVLFYALAEAGQNAEVFLPLLSIVRERLLEQMPEQFPQPEPPPRLLLYIPWFRRRWQARQRAILEANGPYFEWEANLKAVDEAIQALMNKSEP